MLFNEGTSTNEFTDGIEFIKEGLTPLWAALKESLIPEKNVEILTSMESKAKTIQRQISSIQISDQSAQNFRNKLIDIYEGVSEIGGSFKDVTDVIGGLSTSLNRVVEPSGKLVTSMVETSKATGIAANELGKMAGEFTKLTFSQEKSMELINKISTSARQSGLNIKSVLSEVEKNISKVNAYNFKGGVDGLTKMVLEAQRLGKSIDDIGAASLGRSFAFDPEKAIEAAAGMSMLGGSMSNLSNPFQLMNMGANNVGKLQTSLIDMSKAAFSLNESTGEIETNFVAQQRLYEQLKAIGKEGEYEKFINMGRESAKQAMIIKQVSESGIGDLFGEGKMFDEKQQGLIAQLAEIGPGGKISLDLPGVGSISDLSETLKNSDSAEKFKNALKEYDDMAKKTEKEIAQNNLTITESQAKDVRIIRESLLRELEDTERNKILKDVEESLKTTREATKEVGGIFGGKAKTALLGLGDLASKATEKQKEYFGVGDNADVTKQDTINTSIEDNDVMNDAFFDTGNKKLSMGKGEMFSFIQDDQAIFAPDIDEKLGILKSYYMKVKDFENMELKPFELTNNMPDRLENIRTTREEKKESKETVQKIEGSGTININVNISSSGDLASSLMSDRRFRNDLETEILNTMKNKDLLMVQKP